MVELGVEVWRTGSPQDEFAEEKEMPVVMKGTAMDVPFARNYNKLTEEAGIQRIQNAGFRIKCGMTEKRRRL